MSKVSRVPFENTTAAQEKREAHRRAKGAEDAEREVSGARGRARKALEALQLGEDVDLELVGKLTLVDVMANGEDKDRVNAARAFLAPRKAKEEPAEAEVPPAWLSDPEAAKPVTGGGEGAP